MTNKALGVIGRIALWSLPVLIAVLAYLVAYPWLKQNDPAYNQVAILALMIWMFGYTGVMARRHQRRLDEVELASQRFAISHGWDYGMIAASLLLLLPPVMNWLVDLAITMSGGSPDAPNRGTVHLAFFGGLAMVVMAQTVGILVASLIWWRRMAGMRERS